MQSVQNRGNVVMLPGTSDYSDYYESDFDHSKGQQWPNSPQLQHDDDG